MQKIPFWIWLLIFLTFGFKGILLLSVIGMVLQNPEVQGHLSKIFKKNKRRSATPSIFSSFNYNFMNWNIKTTLGVFLSAAVLLVLLDGFTIIPVGQVGIIFDKGRGVLDEPLDTGIHLKIPFWQKITMMNTQLQTYTMSGSNGEGEVYGNDSIEALTKDGQKVRIDMTVQFSLSSRYAPRVYEEIGIDYKDKVVRPASRSIVRKVITAYTSKELFQEETRSAAEATMRAEMKANIEVKHLVLNDVLLRNIQFSDIYLQAIEEKQIAEQKIQKAEFEKQQALIVKERNIIEAEAEAESIKLKGEALRQNPAVIQFNMVEKLSPNIKWGILPDSVMPLLDLKNMQQ